MDLCGWLSYVPTTSSSNAPSRFKTDVRSSSCVNLSCQDPCARSPPNLHGKGINVAKSHTNCSYSVVTLEPLFSFHNLAVLGCRDAQPIMSECIAKDLNNGSMRAAVMTTRNFFRQCTISIRDRRRKQQLADVRIYAPDPNPVFAWKMNQMWQNRVRRSMFTGNHVAPIPSPTPSQGARQRLGQF